MPIMKEIIILILVVLIAGCNPYNNHTEFGKLNLDSEGDFMQLISPWVLIHGILSGRVAFAYECNVSGWFS